MTPAASRTPPRALLVALVLLLATAAWWVSPAEAANTTVEVRADSYAPATITVEVGDTVTWVWKADGHSVTHRTAEGEQPAFDSHPECVLIVNCGQTGQTFKVEFTRAGTYDYFSRSNPDVTGRVTVRKPAPEPEPTESSSPSPEPEPTTSPSPSPKPTRSPSPTPTTAPPPDPPAAGTAQAPRVEMETPSESASPTASPSVAVPEPTFEGFPEVEEPSAEAVVGEVDIQPPDGGGASRVIWGAIGGLTVLGTLGAFGRVVLFGDTWRPGHAG